MLDSALLLALSSQLSQNCPRKAATYAFNGSATSPDIAANTGVAYWNLNNEDEIPTSTWFVMAWVSAGKAT